jgi:uncharacterized protein (UPF0335 family)
MSNNDDHYTGALLEDMNDNYGKILEMLSLLSGVPADIKEVNERLKNVEQDVKVIKHVVRDHSKTLHNHEHRLARLELA